VWWWFEGKKMHRFLTSRITATPAAAAIAIRRNETNNQKILKRFMGGGHGHGPAPPTFVRLPQPNRPVHEESELVWNDGVAPELTVDFDAPDVSKLKGLASWLAGLTFFASLMLVSKYIWDPPSFKPVARRIVDVGDALGGYPNPRRPENAEK
jgi:hypothetical protein